MNTTTRALSIRVCLLLTLLAAFLLSPLRAQAPAAGAPATTAVARALLWRIEGPTPNYLFGTIHLPDARVTTLAPQVQAAVDACDALYTELPMEVAAVMRVQARTQLPKGQHLRDVLGPELHARLAAYVSGKGVGMALLDRIQPWAVATQLAVIDQLAQMATKVPLDLQLYNGAKKAKKVVGGLETFEEQFAVFEDLTTQEQQSMLSSMLDDLEEDARAGKNTGEHLLQLYLRGDEQAIDAELNEFKIGDPQLRAKLMQRLLVDRNQRMADRIVQHLQEAPDRCHFFAVGAAHYAGAAGLLQLLGKRGYRLTRMDATDPAAALARDLDALDAEIVRRTAELAQLQARRDRLQSAGSGR